MELEVINSFSGLEGLRSDWAQLTERISGLTPFQLPEWQMLWWQHFGSGHLRVLVFRDRARRIVGIIPCFLHEWNYARQLTLIGSGMSDYLEPPLDPKCEDDILYALEEYLSASLEWDRCEWQDLAPQTPFQRMQKVTAQLSADTPCSELPIHGSFADFTAGLSKNLKRNLRRYRERAEEAGELLVGASIEADPNLLHALIEMHGARWRRRGEPGMIEVNHSGDFLRAIAEEFAARGCLRLFWLRYRDRLAAMILAFQHRKKIFGYLTAFDPAHEALGLGRTLLYEALRFSFDNGLDSWDFLRGDEIYKSWWQARTIPKVRLVLTRKA